MEKTIPYMVYAESTPNPTTMKFVANRIVLENGLAEYTSMEQAQDSPLALELFRFPFVTGVFIQDNFITVMKSDMVPWDEVVMELREFVRSFLNDGGEVVTNPAEAKSVEDPNQKTRETHVQPKTILEERIITILDNEIAPAVARDGGNITFMGFDKGVVSVVLRGACSGCPSATITLKSGIEALLKNRLPGEITEVVAVNG